MQNFVHNGAIVTVTAPAALASGDGFIKGNAFLVATNAAENGAKVEAARLGVVALPKEAAVTPGEGAAAYWDNAAKTVTGTKAAGLYLIGYVETAPAGGDATIDVVLSGVPTFAEA